MVATTLANAAMRASLRTAVAARGTAWAASPSPALVALGIRGYASAKKGAAGKDETNAQAAAKATDSTASASSQPSDLPSNPAAEAQAAERRAATSAFDVDTSALVAAAEEAADKKQTGAQARGTYSSSQEKRSKFMGRLVSVGLVGGGAYGIAQLGREWDTLEEKEKYGAKGENGEAIEDSFFSRLSTRLGMLYGSAKAPVWEKALPDPLPFPYSRPYTLVLDVDDLLIHSEWSRQHAWRTAKRPGLDYFLGYLSQFYEIVLFSRQPAYIVQPVVEKLDPDMRMISYSLFRESCRLSDDGHLVKDLSTLNRDLSKVIAIDTDPQALSLQPENAIILKPWKGDSKDSDLVGLISFLEAIGIYNIQDVRQTLKAYEGTHIPSEHIKRQKQLREHEEEEWRAKHSSRGSFFGGISGAAGAKEMPKTWYELEQERNRQGYMEEQKFWADNGEKFRQMAKDEQEKKLKEMKMNAWNMASTMFTGMPPPQAGGEQDKPSA